MSPGDLGRIVKPFVFLDLFEMGNVKGRGFAPHPHSGIATLTTFLEGSMSYGDTTGKTGSLSTGAVEWMRAGRGCGTPAIPPQARRCAAISFGSHYPRSLNLHRPKAFTSNRIASNPPALRACCLALMRTRQAPIHLPMPLTYLHVRLIDGQRWTYQPGPLTTTWHGWQ